MATAHRILTFHNLMPFLILHFALVCQFAVPHATTSDSTTKTSTTSEVPRAIPQPRLPPSYSVVEANVTDSYTEVTAKGKKIIDPEGETPTNRTSQPNYEPSSTTSSENYVAIGDYFRISNYSRNVERGFRPFVPSASFAPVPEFKAEYKVFEPQEYKYNIPTNQEQVYHYNNYPTYAEVQSDGGDGSVYSNLYEQHKLPYITTMASSKINPMHRPSLYKKKKLPLPYYESLGISQYYGKYQPDFHEPNGYIEPPELLEDTAAHDLYHKPTFIDRKRKRNSLLHLLTTLIPLGLLLTALPPRVVFINSTNPTKVPQGQKTYFRNIEKNLFQIHNISDSASNILQNVGLESSDQPNCNKLEMCEAALRGIHSPDSSEDSSIWQLLSKSSDIIRENLDLQDVFEAVLQKRCSIFPCTNQQSIQERALYQLRK